MDELREKIADIVADSLLDADLDSLGTADRIIALLPHRICDLCDQPATTLRCNECAQIMASDY